MTNCVYCDQIIDPKDEYTTVDFNGNEIHECCLNDDESEPIATIHALNKKTEDFIDVNGYGVPTMQLGYHHNWTDGIFNCSSHFHNYRGYYEPTSDEFTEVWENHVTMGYGNENLLEKFDQIFTEFVQEYDIIAVRVLSITSNCLSSGLGYWVKNTDLKRFNNLATEELKELLEK